VIVAGVPTDWLAPENQPELPELKALERPGLRMHGAKPQSFRLSLSNELTVTGLLFGFMNNTRCTFYHLERGSGRDEKGTDPPETVVGVAFEVEAKVCEPPFRLKFRDYPDANVPAKKYEYPAVLDELIH